MLRLPAHARRYRLSHQADAIGRRQERWGHQSGAAVQIVSDIFEHLSPIGPVHGAVLLGPRRQCAGRQDDRIVLQKPHDTLVEASVRSSLHRPVHLLGREPKTGAAAITMLTPSVPTPAGICRSIASSDSSGEFASLVNGWPIDGSASGSQLRSVRESRAMTSNPGPSYRRFPAHARCLTERWFGERPVGEEEVETSAAFMDDLRWWILWQVPAVAVSALSRLRLAVAPRACQSPPAWSAWPRKCAEMECELRAYPDVIGAAAVGRVGRYQIQ